MAEGYLAISLGLPEKLHTSLTIAFDRGRNLKLVNLSLAAIERIHFCGQNFVSFLFLVWLYIRAFGLLKKLKLRGETFLSLNSIAFLEAESCNLL